MMSRTMSLVPSRPKAAARAGNDRYEPEHEIDRDDAADLIERNRGAVEVPRLHGTEKPAPWGEEKMQEQEHHDDAGRLHDMDVEPCALEPAEMEKQHGIAAREEHDDAGPNPGKEAAEDPLPERKTQTWLERSCRGTQHHIGEEHAADPRDSSKRVKRNQHRHALEPTPTVAKSLLARREGASHERASRVSPPWPPCPDPVACGIWRSRIAQSTPPRRVLKPEHPARRSAADRMHNLGRGVGP